MKPDTSRPALKISTIPAHHVQLREGERRSIVCPECQEWHLLRRNVVWPHHLERTERGKNGPRCPGSARRVEIDVDLAEWARQVAEADATVTGRRSNRVNRKPGNVTPPPVSRFATALKESTPRLPAVLERARTAIALHRDACPQCRSGARCEKGRELEIWLGETEASSRFAQEQKQRAERQAERVQARQRAAQWRRVQRGVTRTDTQRKAQIPQT
ncbi:hypothetical protein [Streptomyces capitiformicae]|uniref:Uncharacterized protein n=1 Tax=Streptomyces capitiformicae TaxID=2014920 RepID=A0A918Z2U9_9ACTN|nr:hypothetical protein [Streptomyces capitiformicae]GHE33985.1 hypothetical protein GCM10017771_51330 [Streptomyces capitiformicae]